MLRLPHGARRLVVRVASLQCPAQRDLLSRAILPSMQRFFATPGRPRKAVGEPSKTVKRAVKRTAKTPDGTAPTRKTPAKKIGTGARASAAAKKPKAKKPKKAITEKQKAAQEARKARDQVTELKKAALSPPSAGTRLNAFTVFFAEKARGSTGTPGSEAAKERARSIAQEWKAVSPAELEHYNHLAQQERQKRQAEYKSWVESHTPEQIQAANRARNALKRKQPKNKKRYGKIEDERKVKGPVTAYLQFSIDRNASGDFANIRVADRAKLIGQEWKALSESEKKKYKDRQSEEHSRYVSEYSSVYGTPPPAAQVASAAA